MDIKGHLYGHIFLIDMKYKQHSLFNGVYNYIYYMYIYIYIYIYIYNVMP